MELVDLYDENRIPLGKTAERYGHKEPGEYRTVVHVCIFAPDGRMLVQQRTSCKVIWPDRWDVSAAGGVDAGEDSRMAAERECREELGYPLDLTGVRATLSVNFPQGFDDFFLVERDVDLKALKLQRKLFRDDRRELTREEYQRLLDAAHGLGRERLALLLETICATGIRVSEVKYITVEAARAGRAEVSLKGKLRTILLPGKLCRKLKKYARAQKIASGEIFLTRSGRGISRKQVWAEMKAVCRKAGVADSKVFPHNLRHLFARAFYQASRDVVKLADVLGHSSIETTRIYLLSTGAEHARQLARLGLIS